MLISTHEVMDEEKATFQNLSSFLPSHSYIMEGMKAPNCPGMNKIANIGRS